ncbi:hypothetical protein D3C78_1145490 [compost metagenome]
MLNNELSVISKNTHSSPSLDNTYRGRYKVGRFHLTDTFIVEYMQVIHRIEIPDSWVSSLFPDIPDIDSRKVVYMESCDILSNGALNEIRNVVKSPPKNLKIYRNGDYITKIEI